MDRDAIQQERQARAAAVITQLKATIAPVLARYPVAMAYLYGSMARGRPLPTSDIDIALVLTNPPAPYERLKLELTIQADLEDASQLRELDVRSINQAPLMVQGRILQEGLLLYERDRELRIAFEVLTRKKYFDYLPTAEWLDEQFLTVIREKGLPYGLS
jgi:predicted nucleotidyltransferase